MKFSIIIPTFDRRRLLAEALASVWAQTFLDFETIVVDDGSTDDTWSYLKSLGSRVRSLRGVNTGPGGARNLGASHATGEYLAFLDSDDLWFPWALGVFAELATRFREPALLAAKVVELEGATAILAGDDQPIQALSFPDYLASSRSAHSVGAGMAVLKREEFNRLGGFSGARLNAEDHDLVLRAGIAPGFIQVVSPATLAYRRHPMSATSDTLSTARGCMRLIGSEQKGGYPGGAERAMERRRIISRHVRPASIACLRLGLTREASALYRATAGWNVRLGNWKYLLGFPYLLAASRGNRSKRPVAIEDSQE